MNESSSSGHGLTNLRDRVEALGGRLRVVIAEDNYLVREGTSRLVEDSGDVGVLAAVGNAEQLRELVQRISPPVSLP